MNELLLKQYARLVVKTAINIQPQQTLVITAPIECASFVRLVSRIAFEEGARDVVLSWRDELSSKIRFLNANEEVFDEFPKWQQEFYLHYMHQGAAFLRISAEDPELMKNIDASRMMRAQKASNLALQEYRESLMANKNVWSVISVPTVAWARRVFPHLSEEDAVVSLWQAIFTSVRANVTDPVAAWNLHKQNLKKSMDFLNSHQFELLRFRNSLGTDLQIELPKDHIWLGGAELSSTGIEFIANMPTEEVFTAPSRTGVSGKVVSSKPLQYNGNLIVNFSLTFEKGRIVSWQAEKGEEVLSNLIATDEGSAYLGEVALVPHESPISQSNILFYNTLFDENASCHLAIGKAYPVCIKNSEQYNKEELQQLGINDSLVHEDFMIGTEDLEIEGITTEGKLVAVFKNGNFAY